MHFIILRIGPNPKIKNIINKKIKIKYSLIIPEDNKLE